MFDSESIGPRREKKTWLLQENNKFTRAKKSSLVAHFSLNPFLEPYYKETLLIGLLINPFKY